ncbi:hypothetical protein SETIT_3G334700v2 [Setaria italica]|uniref:Uncharacterized protein n=1 Tax=Setaria italica TaxID=4555 RepID=A0A368QM63_SETIT|nr:hypothetical protein SETIT_3G334700v2 [Setaria italica]
MSNGGTPDMTHEVWVDIKTVLRRMWKCMMIWKPMFKGTLLEVINKWCNSLEEVLKTPLAIEAP